MFEFKLPDVGEGMHEAEMLRWLVGPGETVKVDQPMLEIQTDKAVVEIPAPVAGTVGQILAPVGHIARVGEVLITFETAAKAAISTPANTVATASNQTTPATVGAGGVIVRKPGAVRAAPAVRKRAVELDVDITRVAPSSPDGRVLLKDVEDYAANRAKQPAAAAPVLNGNGNGHAGQNGNGHTTATVEVARAPEPAPLAKSAPPAVIAPRFEGGESEERRALAGLRRRIAERMEQSWRTIPHAAAFGEADVTNLVALRGQLQETAQQRGVKMTYLPLIVKAVGRVLKQYPIFNASLDEQTREVVYKGYYHIGLATATPEGLVVPVVRHADKLTLLELAAEINRLSEGGRQRSLKPAELSGSTFTISNVGSYGGSYGVAVINPPEAAILAVGKATEQAVIRDGQIVARQIMPLSLSFDHRLIDGAEAGAFLNALTALLENPSLLLLDAV